MTEAVSTTHAMPDPQQDVFSKNVLGFWIYLMTDCMLFGTLFSTYAILHRATFDGPGPKELFQLHTVIAETAALLLSSVACGLGVLAAVRSQRNKLIAWMAVAFIMGASFVALEINEFVHLVKDGHTWESSAFLSAFFTLVGTHGTHVSIGLLWLLVLFFQFFYYGITVHTFRRVVIFSMFWHFLDLVWIFIFTFVYLLGVA